jgi:hypothetical protein
MFNEKVLNSCVVQGDPIKQICTKEYIHNVYKFGSYLSIVNNKKINPTALFIQILQNKKLRDCFVKVTEAENEYAALLGLLQLYPILLKSKNTKRLFKKSITK